MQTKNWNCVRSMISGEDHRWETEFIEETEDAEVF